METASFSKMSNYLRKTWHHIQENHCQKPKFHPKKIIPPTSHNAWLKFFYSVTKYFWLKFGLETFTSSSLLVYLYLKNATFISDVPCKYIYQGRELLRYTILHSRNFQFFKRFAVVLKKKWDTDITQQGTKQKLIMINSLGNGLIMFLP
jgi:hypothetical protein